MKHDQHEVSAARSNHQGTGQKRFPGIFRCEKAIGGRGVAHLGANSSVATEQKCVWQGDQASMVGLRENLQETMVFTIKYKAFL